MMMMMMMMMIMIAGLPRDLALGMTQPLPWSYNDHKPPKLVIIYSAGF